MDSDYNNYMDKDASEEVRLGRHVTWVGFWTNACKTKAALKKAFQNAIDKKGTSVVEVVSTCNSGWKMSPEKANEWMAQNMFEKYPLGELKNVDK